MPGDPDSSELIQRVTEQDPDLRMPPASHGDPLDGGQIALLRAWIEGGAEFEAHWSYLAPQRPGLPVLHDTGWVRNPIDAFVLQRLRAEGLEPNPPAERHDLMRRASLVLTGLPPTPEQTRRFLEDTGPRATEEMIDRLLDDPGYGERWAAVWLDLARYADSQGYSSDNLRSIWPWRDYVVRAFNENRSFEQFTLEQIAGDLLPNPTVDSRVATAFHRNTLTNTEGGTDDEEFRNAAVIDRVNTTFAVWMGTTMACAQCHTHKYDPITQQEYFRFFDVFNQTADRDLADDAPTEMLFTAEDSQRKAGLESELAELEKKMAGSHATSTGIGELLGRWQESRRAGIPEIRSVRIELPGERRILSLAEVVVWSGGRNIARTGLASQSSDHPQYAGEAGRAIDGNTSGLFVRDATTTHTLEETGPWWQLTLEQAARVDAVTIHNRNDSGLHTRLNGFTLRLLGPEGETVWQGSSAEASQHSQRISVDEVPVPIADLLDRPQNAWTEAESALVGEYAESVLSATDPVRLRLSAIREELASIRPYATVPVLEELAPENRRVTKVQVRGNFLQTGEPVKAGVPSAFHPLPDNQPVDRLAVARWLVDRKNPLTARVLVNRLWEQMFGVGLVETCEEFGSQGELPSHPELLDWMAVELMESGWDTRHLIRLIAESSTWQQSSSATAEKLAVDRYNRFLARGPRVRLSAEMVRDQALAVSGLLSRRMGGPPVHPPKPKLGLRLAFSSATTDWETSSGEDRYRRALYTELRRSMPYPSLSTFDCPNREVSELRRIFTNTPLQALVTLNDPVFLEAATALARRMIAESPDAGAEARVAFGFLLCLNRPPLPSESSTLVRLYQETLEHYGAEPVMAADFIAACRGALPAEEAGCAPIPAASMAAWITVANVLLNLDEFLQIL